MGVVLDWRFFPQPLPSSSLSSPSSLRTGGWSVTFRSGTRKLTRTDPIRHYHYHHHTLFIIIIIKLYRHTHKSCSIAIYIHVYDILSLLFYFFFLFFCRVPPCRSPCIVYLHAHVYHSMCRLRAYNSPDNDVAFTRRYHGRPFIDDAAVCTQVVYVRLPPPSTRLRATASTVSISGLPDG
jgi:hypothetical protein